MTKNNSPVINKEGGNTNEKRKATIYETTFRKRRKGIVYRMVVIHYEDGSGEKFLVPPTN
jgi:hypothetical protein